MINLEYVDGAISMEYESVVKPYESFMESCKNDINTMFADFDLLSERVTLESAVMGSVPDNMMVVYESEKKNIFTKIGEMVVAIYNKFVELIDRIIDSIKTFSFRKKTDLQKLDILLKHHPDLKNEAIAAFNEGALDLSDVRSLKELDSTFDEILKLARKKDIDPKSLRGKWEKAKENFEKDEKSWKIVKVAAAATTIIAAAVAVKTFSAKCVQATNDATKDKQELREKKAEILARLKDEGLVTEDTGKWQTLLQIWRELNGKHSAVRSENLKVIDKLSNGITKFLDKFDKVGGKQLQSDLSETKKQMDKAAKDAYDANLKKIEDEQKIRNKVNLAHSKKEQKARLEVQDKYYNKHRDELLEKEREIAIARNDGKIESEHNHPFGKNHP